MAETESSTNPAWPNVTPSKPLLFHVSARLYPAIGTVPADTFPYTVLSFGTADN